MIRRSYDFLTEGNLITMEDTSSETQTQVDNTTGIKYIINRWQTTGVVPSQVVRQPLPPVTKIHAFERINDLSDIPTKYEKRFTALRDATINDVTRERSKRVLEKQNQKEKVVDTQPVKEQVNQDTDTLKSDE